MTTTNGVIVYYDSQLITADAGTEGQIFTSNGDGSPPSMKDVVVAITVDKHVSAQGNDTTGNGSLNSPFLTVKKALDVIFDLGDYSATKNYAIYIHGVVTESADPLMLPFCHLIGDGSIWDLGGNDFTFKPGVWDAATQFCKIQNIDMRGQSVSMLMSALTATNVRIINWDNVGLPLAIGVSGPDFQTVHEFRNCYLYEANTMSQISVIDADTVAISFDGGDTCSTINIADTAAQSILYLSNCRTGSVVNANCITNGCYLTIHNIDAFSLFTTFNFDGALTSFYADASLNQYSVYPGSNFGLAYSDTDANFIIPILVPVNYTPTSPPFGFTQKNLENHLQGIDTAIGASGSTTSYNKAVGSAVSLTTAVVADVISGGFTLTAGLWLVTGSVGFTGSSLTSTAVQAFIGTSTGNSSAGRDLSLNTVATSAVPTAATDVILSIPSQIISVASTTTYYLKALATFSAGTCSAYGNVRVYRLGNV